MTKKEEIGTRDFMEQVLFLKRNNYTEEEIAFFIKVIKGIANPSDANLGEQFDKLLDIVCELDEKINKLDNFKIWKRDE